MTTTPFISGTSHYQSNIRVSHSYQVLVRVPTFKNTLIEGPHLLFSTGHSGKHGHEFLEFEYSHGRLRYANNSNYDQNATNNLIRREST